MPNTNSAKKAVRQTKRLAERNRNVKLTYKQSLKAARKAIEAGAQDVADKIRTAQKAIDKAAEKGVIKPNTASRYNARLQKQSGKKVKA